MIQATPSKKVPLLNADIEDSNAASPEIRSASTRSAISLDNEDDGFRERKQGHKLFFVCCDTKRAVLWLNTIELMLNIFILTAAVMSDRAKAEGYNRAMIVRGCGMFVTFTTLLGAYWYSKSIVLVGLVHTCYQLTVAVFKITRFNWDGGYNEESELEVLLPIIWNSLLFYAEGMFISEVNDGIMSSQTYKRREMYSCCCDIL
mmetsp:Transcript_31985/g.57816  ORF Transcript_31985/g.57816 Transcript_31985/m.57816 type:complete len:203 (-) Transcript_31985:384-992(-)